MSIKSVTDSNIDADFEEKIARIAEKLIKISNKYFRHPPRMCVLIAPFKGGDVLKLRFREPVELRYQVEYSYPIGYLCSSSVFVDLDHHAVNELKIVFEDDGNISAIRMRGVNGDVYEYRPLSISTTSALATLFIPDVFEKIVESEIASDRGLADKWFISLIDAYRAVSEYASSVSLEDIYAESVSIGRVSLYVMYGKNILEFELDKNSNELLITPHIYTENQLFNIGTTCYSLQHRKVSIFPPIYIISASLVLANIRKTKMLVAEFPEKILDDVDGFLKKFSRAYTQLIIALHYLRVSDF